MVNYVGHMRLVDGQTLTDRTVLDEVAIAEKRHLCAASEFCQKFKTCESTPRVLLVTTVNPKHLGVRLFSMLFPFDNSCHFGSDIFGASAYFRLSSNSDIANMIAPEVVTKPESVTLEELFSYMKQKSSKVAWFERTATIDDVAKESAWYYISCGGCKSKAVNGHTSLICNNKKCEKTEVTGVAQYLTKISVYDKSELATFVILGDAGKELTGKHAAELVANYFEANDAVGAEHFVPVPQALLDTIGKTRKFIVKVSDHNLTGKTQTITVTKVLPPDAPLPAASADVPGTGCVGSGPSKGSGDCAGDRARKAAEMLESDEVKRTKSG
ncbi:hypothetical protein Bca52824_001396 [Brassica carinata]|uniref:Replication factor A C-terminal domain-containing protein n=1 Tax=Brassica carinata TaxID=52824 RepID=A0A8X7WIG5_BRACI|nr:hypothetical protein Bca52824_001396 [Brassica carinata]